MEGHKFVVRVVENFKVNTIIHWRTRGSITLANRPLRNCVSNIRRRSAKGTRSRSFATGV